MPARLATALLLALALAACPKLHEPERGVELVYASHASAKAAVEKRLAEAELKAKVVESDEVLTVRVPAGSDPAPVKQLLATRGRLELCEVLEAEQQKLCTVAVDGGVEVEPSDDPKRGCTLRGPTAAAVRPLAEAVVSERVLLEPTSQMGVRGVRTWAAPKSGCVTPTVTEARSRESEFAGPPTVSVKVDDASAKAVEALTTKLVGRRLLLVLDDEVLAVPVVMTPIPGGKLQLLTARHTPEESALLAAALAGGALPELTLQTERPSGPPTLVPR